MHKLLDEVTTGAEALESTFGAGLFDLYAQRPKSEEAFTKCMRALFGNPTIAVEYDFSQHHTLLDLGGGMGVTTKEIYQFHSVKNDSKLTKAIVFDLPKVVIHGSFPEAEYVGGSFFELSTIPTGADVILINGVLHDWNDDECLAILSNAQAVLANSPNSRIVVADFIVPDSKSHPLFNAITRFDIFMMTVSTGHFRTMAEYKKVFESANLTLIDVRPTRSLNSLFVLAKKEA